MRLGSIYIPEGVLPHVFGLGHKGQTLNLGGKYNYFFNETDTDIVIINREENKFINNFWGDNIALITTIVGKNAVGKTSILRALNNPMDSGNKKLVYIIETGDESKIKVVNETVKNVLDKIDLVLEVITNKSFEPLFYSPVLDYDLKSAFSPISLVNYFNDSLENYYLDSITRNIFLLNDDIIKDIKKVYTDFPYYDKIKVTAKKHRKSNFRQIYLEANFGNPHRGDALKHEIDGQIMQLENPTFYKESFSKEEVIDLLKSNVNLLESESFTEQFNKIWDLEDYKYIDKEGYDYIHNSNDFIKNLEINLLSYLLLGAVFPQTGLGGGTNFNNIGNTTNFKERLNFFLEMYLINEYKLLTEKITSDLGGINVYDKEKIISIINNDTWVKTSGADVQPIRDRMKNDVISFYAILEFYDFIVEFCQSSKISTNKEGLVFNLQNNEVDIFNNLIENYKSLLDSIPNSPMDISIFDFSPNKKLSTGEKALIDFYASIFSYIEKNKSHQHTNYEHYLLLLDEPELGFHPLWKKKFINAIVKTLPILFSKIAPKVYDEISKNYIKTRENPVLQIIFTTHDPLTVSDIPNSNIIYLQKDNEITSIVDKTKGLKKSFGANITDLLSDSFFIGSEDKALVGEFAREKIEITINWINGELKKKEHFESNYSINDDEYKHHEKIISIIDEQIIKMKLAEMLEKLKDSKKLQEQLIQNEIDFLMQKKDDLYKS